MSELYLTDGCLVDQHDYGDNTGCAALLAEAGIKHEVDDGDSNTYSSYGIWPE